MFDDNKVAASPAQPRDPFGLGNASTFAAGPMAQRVARQLARTDAFPAPQHRPLAPMRLDQRDDVEAGLFWALETAGNTTVVAIFPDGPAKARWLDKATLSGVTEWATTKNKAGWNLYFTVNLPTPGLNKKAEKKEITHLRAAAFADIDAKEGRMLDDAYSLVLKLPPTSTIIASGGGVQPIWWLPSPVLATAEAVALSETLGERVAALVGGDPIQNVDRVLRLPFSVNYPNKKKAAAGRSPCLSGLLRVEAS